MQLEQGSILEGKVTGILKFGAFVDIGEGKSGMVHISEVSHTFVNDINEVLKIGQTVKVKVIAIGEDGKIGLSIKKAEPPAPRENRDFKKRPDFKNGSDGSYRQDKDAPARPKHFAPKKPVKKETVSEETLRDAEYAYEPRQSVTDAGFEDMLSKFKASSEDRMSDLKRNMDVKKRTGRRK